MRRWLKRWPWAERARPEPDAFPTFGAEDIDVLAQVYAESGDGAGPAWDRYRHAHMRLPDWFDATLDPWGNAYASQQMRLWRLMTGIDRDYDAGVDEREVGWEDVDPVRLPGFYKRRDPAAVQAAADHVLATGMLLQQSRLKPGDWALEYGAGFGQTALALARLGVNVDTVDISESFCGFVRQQAEFFGVPLHAHVGTFGSAPRPDRRYRLIWFYESFHHCVEFKTVVPRLDRLLDADGRILLAGEPIVERPYAAVPYPWGVRLHSEVAVVMRRTGWFELGFTEDFLMELFARSGFSGTRIECPPSPFGRVYAFERERPRSVGS